MKKALTFVLLLGLFSPSFSYAHPGRTDSSGCHTCRTNCSSWGLSTGEYHCHRAKALPQPEEPIKSTYGENGTGYTLPAPEYKTPTVKPSPTTNIANINSALNQNNIQNQIRDKVNSEKDNYYKNPHLFREKLLEKLNNEFKSNSWCSHYVYTLLPDVK